MRKMLEIHRMRRQTVLSIVESNRRISFDLLVENSGFSRSEVRAHLAVLAKVMENRVYFVGKNKEWVMSSREKAREERDRIYSFNEFMYGCSNPVHVHGVGYIDPNTREGKRYLDP
jgi:hypothetical protein